MLNAEELAKTWATPPCDEWEEATVLSRALLIAIDALEKVCNSDSGYDAWKNVVYPALAKIRGEKP